MRLIQSLSLIVPILAQQFPIRIQELDQPEFDLASFKNNEAGLLGDFDTVTTYSYLGASNFTNQVNSDSNSLIYKNNKNQYVNIGEIRNGIVKDILPLREEQWLILGDFQSIGDYNASAPTIFNLTSGQFSNIEIDGNVTTALFDGQDLVYLGGNFTYNSTNSAAVFNLSSETLNVTSFYGFGRNSHVNSIIRYESNIIFAGQFDTLGYPGLLSTSRNSTNNSIEADQVVPMKYATFSSSDSSSNPENVVCPNSTDSWHVPGTVAALNIGLPYSVIPSKIRIYNDKDIESQISLFRLITEPASGIMNLTFIDPKTGELAVCDAWCPLYNASTLSNFATENSRSLTAEYGEGTLSFGPNYQDFGFVNLLDVSSLTFQALNSYGSNVGLSGLQIFQSTFSTFANNQLNEPSCDSTEDYSRSDLIGDWTVSNEGYLKTTVESGSKAGVIFHPNINHAGEYSILLYTPGCGKDNSCSSRGAVNVTVIDEEEDTILESHVLYQTNVDMKYDSIFNGRLNGSVRVEMMLDSSLPSPGSIELVADRIGTTILSIDDVVYDNRSVPINGLFEYSPANFTRLNPKNLTESLVVGNTTINTLGGDLSKSANIFLALNNGSIIVAGDFESAMYGDNFLEADVDGFDEDGHFVEAKVIPVDGGLNNAVLGLYPVQEGVIVLGQFDNTNNQTDINSIDDSSSTSLNNSAFFNGSWFALPPSISGNSFLNITLNGQDFWVFGDDKWDVSKSARFNDSLLLSFNVTASGVQGDDTLFAGSLTYSDALVNRGLLSNGSSFANVTNETLENSSIETGLFINGSLSAFGGQFTTSNGLTNLFLVGNETSGLGTNWSEGSSVSALFAFNNQLFIGSSSDTEASNNTFEAVAIYDLINSSFVSPQPGALASSSGLSVSQFGILNDTYLVVGGSFDSAGDFGCSGICFYNLNESTWESLIEEFSGNVSTFRFVNNTLVCGGLMTYKNMNYKLFSYDFNSTEQAAQPDAFESLNQTVNKFLLVDNSTAERIIVSNEYSIAAYNGSQWSNITNFENGSVVRDINLLQLSQPNDANDGKYFDADKVLLASGDLKLPSYGYSNLAYFNSTHWIPYLITTSTKNGSSLANSIFMNKDMSSLYRSGSLSAQKPDTSNSSTPTPSHSGDSGTVKEKSDKMDRGFVVLVSLAAAVGTVSVLGAAVASVLYKKRKHEYTPLEPRVNETEMLDTVPPENLLKHL